jgi:hypothetical protein
MQPESPSPRLFRQEDGGTAAGLKSLLQQLADLAADGEPLHIVLDFRGNHVELTSGPAAPAPVDRLKLTPCEKDILEAIGELGGEPVGAVIAKHAGWEYDAHVKTKLSSLRTRGLIGGARGEIGYPLTPKGQAAIEPPPGII